MRVLVAVVVWAAAGTASAAPVLDAIEIVGQPAAVRLHLSAPVATEARTLAANGAAPARIYLDLPDTALSKSLPRVTLAPDLARGTSPLLRVRAGQHDVGRVRVVLDLARATSFTIDQTERTITIALEPSAPKTVTTPPPVADAHPTRVPAAPARLTAPPPPARTAAAPRPAPPPERRSPEPRESAPPSVPSRPEETEERPPPPPALAMLPPALSRRFLKSPRFPGLPEHPVIVLDAGHGGRDPGAEGFGGVVEKDVVLELAQVLARRLAARLPVDVLMTRVDDSFVPIQRRLAAPGERATVFISLHANACSDPTARGLEIFYGGGAVRSASSGGFDPRAALLGRCLDEALEARIGGVRGAARPGIFGVLVRNPVPSALVEIGYLTHPDEAARARDADFQELLADAVTDGVAAFLRASAPPL